VWWVRCIVVDSEELSRFQPNTPHISTYLKADFAMFSHENHGMLPRRIGGEVADLEALKTSVEDMFGTQ
jgi:hypothetical protein